MAELRTFDPVGAFQGARRNQQVLAAEQAAAPRRNQLQDLNIDQARQTQAQQGTTFDQQQSLQRAKIIGQSAQALGGLPLEQRDAAFVAISPQLQKFGIDPNLFPPGSFTDQNLQRAIAESQAFVGSGGDVSALDQAKTGKAQAETASIAAKTAALGVGVKPTEKQIAETEKLKAETAQIRAKISSGGKLSPIDAKVLEEEGKATVKANVGRIAELEQSSNARASSIKKAKQFKRQLSSGERGSGTTRTIAGFFPGVFTDQAEFDQKFNAFAEVAARQQLKASGETRPTDADVEGMKRAMFGVGRDEPVNIQLLSEFISDQEDTDEELDALRDAKDAGVLAEFVGVTETNDKLKVELDAKRARLEELRAKAGQ